MNGALQRAGPLLVLAGLALAAAIPFAAGLSTGASKETIQDPHFAEAGCTACHGGSAFAAGGSGLVRWTIKDAAGAELKGNTFTKDTVYTINITLDEQNAPGSNNHAGFNLRTSAGKLSVPAGNTDVKVTADGSQATHANARNTHWAVAWTAPADGVVVFDLFVNDVDGSGAPDAGDRVYRVGFWLTDSHGAMAGAAEEHEVHYGVSLQQYWIGLIGLAGMVFIMVAGYVYLKYGSKHNTDAKDR